MFWNKSTHLSNFTGIIIESQRVRFRYYMAYRGVLFSMTYFRAPTITITFSRSMKRDNNNYV